MAESNMTIEYILAKSRIKVENIEEENFKHFL